MSIDQIISSGLLELYVIGEISPSDALLVEKAMKENEFVRNEISEIELAFQSYATHHAVSAPPTIKPLLFAAVNYTTRLENGEIPVIPPSLSEESKISDYSQWLENENMQEPEEYDLMYGSIISSDHHKTTMIVWLKEGAPDEIHTDEIEKFLIVEGTCDIKIGDTIHSLKRGDFLSIPLFISHSVTVTSSTRCKVILERAAA